MAGAPLPPTRRERDSMGELEVPADAYYGASTMRAKLNFRSARCASRATSSGHWA